MMTYEEFEQAAFDIADTFPEEFFRELNGGIMVREYGKLHPADENGDLYVLGEYHRNRHLGRFVVLYYGSFELCFGYEKVEATRMRIRKVLLHEFRHHLESLAGERDLEIVDEQELSAYKYRKNTEKT